MKENRYKYETECYLNGFKNIAGVDEAGRGSWAGPIVVASCILPYRYKNDEIKDSKKLSIKKREELYEIIKKDALDYKITYINAEEVDKLNPKQATIKMMKYAINNLKIKPDYVLIDAEQINLNIPHKAIIKGDDKSISIAAASILAKVSRDKYMNEMDKIYPQYDFKKHKGYGTERHLTLLKKYGPIKNFHRYSYKPIKNIKF